MNKKKSKRGLTLNSIRLITVLISLIGLISVASSLNGDNEASAVGPYYYNLELYYNKGNIFINNVSIEFSNEEKSNYNKNNSYYLEIVDNKNKILDKVFFDVPNFVIYDFADEQGNFIETNESGLKILENISFNVFASYYENGYEVIIRDKNNLVLDREFVSQFSKIGFNKEDFINIETNNNFSDEKIVEQKNIKNVSKGKIGDEARKWIENYKNYIIVLSLLILILIIVLVYFLNKKR